MSDPVIDLHADNSAESIPAVLAAPKGKRAKPAKADAAPFTPAPATFADAAEVVPTTAATAEPIIEETTMSDTIIDNTAQATQNAADTAADKAQAMFGDMNARAKGAMEKGAAMFAELNSFNKGNVEALVESGKIAVAGMQSLAQHQAAFVRKQFEEATTAARTMTGVKAPTEFVKLQGDYVRQQFDTMVAEASRSTETVLKLAGEIAQPISNRFALAAEKVRQAA